MQYVGAQKDGSQTGSKSADNLIYTLGNVQAGFCGDTSKTAGQLFVENLHSGAYVPNGLIENTGGIK